MSSKIVLEEGDVGVGRQVRVLSKKCQGRVSSKSVLQECEARASYKSVK